MSDFDFEKVGSMVWSDTPIIIFDLETTGFANKDKIIEFGAVLMVGNTVKEEKHQLVNPGIPISPGASAVNGITDEMVRLEPRWKEVARPCFDFLFQGYPIVAHNFAFDARKLAGQVDPKHWPRHIYTLCTMELARANGHKGKAKLTDLADHYNLEYEHEHTALADAVVTGKLARRFAGAQLVSRFHTKMMGDWADQFSR